MTKIDLISVVQTELSGGVMQSDLRSKFPIPYVSRIIHSWFTGICENRPEIMEVSAPTYDVDVVETNGKFIATLPATPINGGYGIMSVYDGDTSCMVQTPSMYENYKLAYGGTLDNSCKHTGNRLIFDNAPENVIIQVRMLPNFYELNDEDEVILMGAEKYLLTDIPKLVLGTDVRPRDVENNNKPFE